MGCSIGDCRLGSITGDKLLLEGFRRKLMLLLAEWYEADGDGGGGMARLAEFGDNGVC